MPYNSQRHHRRSIRLKGHDYAQHGAYFVTICTHNKVCLFGKVVHDQMLLNENGHRVHGCWNALYPRYPHVTLDAFVVMPNHVHGIIVIADSHVAIPAGAGSPRPCYDGRCEHTLGQMVAYFKYQSTKRINAIRCTPGVRVWQRNYWERIIRDRREWDHVRRYIAENPARWHFGRHHPG